LSNIGRKDPDGFEYRGARGARFYISPGSTMFKRSPEWVMAAELVETTRLWARTAVAITPEWIEEAGEHLINRSHSDPWWDAERGSAVARETVSLFGIPLQTDRVVQYGRVDQEASRDLFIRHALVAGEWDSPHAFAAHNHDQIDTVLEMEERERRTNLLVDDDTLTAWFGKRIPDDITTVRHFDRWWRDVKTQQPHLLDLCLDDLIDPAATAPDPEAFPQIWEYGDLGLPLEYVFDPASATDGVTVDVPLRGLDRIDPAVFEWHVPGLREELAIALIRSLPKSYRKLFAPVPDTARQILARIDPDDGGLLLNLRRELQRLRGVPIPVDAIDLETLPPHLRPTFRILDDEGTEVASGTDLQELKAAIQAETRNTVDTTTHELEATGLTEWSFGELPRIVSVAGSDHTMEAYPALVDEGESVGIRLLANEAEQANAMWKGTVRMLLLNLPSPGKLLRPLLDADAKELLRTGPHADATEWVEDCLGCALGEIIEQSGGPAWNAIEFDRLLATARDELDPLVTKVGRHSLDLLDGLWEAERAFNRLDDERDADVIADVGAQVSSLVYPGFLTRIGSDRINDVRRYLLAIARRIERRPENPTRDNRHMETIHRLEAELDRIAAAIPTEPRLMDIAWMIQELRVSLFAQSIGARGKISEKRVRRLLTEIEMG
jgi:ATP-dependent helicase HrpA